MTDEQINAAIAETCGWKWHDHADCMAKKEGWTMPEKWIMRPDGELVFRHDIPNYCSDLNAMHEAEKILAPKNWNNFSEKWWDYCDFLTFCCNHDTKQSFHATARQRAEAFLRTLGKWDEVQG